LFPSACKRREMHQPLPKRPGFEPGITLMEMLLAVALIAMVIAGVSLGVGAISSTKLRHAASRMGAVISFLAHEAVVKGRPMRLVLDLGAGTYKVETMAVEDDRSAAYLAAGEKRGQGQSEEAPEEELERKSSLSKGEDQSAALKLGLGDFIKPPSQGRQKPAWEPITDGIRVEPLPETVRFASIYTPHQTEPFTQGQGYIYFWPNGSTEHTLVHLSLGDASEDETDKFYSILIDPMTGRAEVKDGRYELPSLDDFDEPGEVEEEETGL
jgi:hypothetical protein